MKIIHYTDLVIQAILIFCAIIFSVISIFSEGDYFFVVLFVQFFLGIWQYSSSMITAIIRRSLKHPKGIHLIVSTVALGAMPLVNSSVISFIVLFLIIPWLLALVYFVLTLKVTVGLKTTGKGFLPHLSF